MRMMLIRRSKQSYILIEITTTAEQEVCGDVRTPPTSCAKRLVLAKHIHTRIYCYHRITLVLSLSHLPVTTSSRRALPMSHFSQISIGDGTVWQGASESVETSETL